MTPWAKYINYWIGWGDISVQKYSTKWLRWFFVLNKWITALTGVFIDDYSYVNGCMSGLNNGLMLKFIK